MGDQEADEIPLGSATMQSDYGHKPQQVMFKVIMDIQEYDYVMEYLPGKTNIADYLSRHPRVCTIPTSAQAADEFAQTVVQAGRVMFIDDPAAITIQENREETRKNATLTKLRHATQTGLNEANNELSPYMADEIKHDLHVVDGVIYHGKRLIVPESLQQRVIELGHESHQGTSKTKSFIR